MLETGWVYRKRMLPYRGEVLVAKGAHVEPWTPVAKIGYLPGKMTRVDVAAQMRVPPERITEFMVKRPGDAIKEGETIASGSLFWERYKATSPASGIVGLVSKYLGHAYIREPIDLGNTEPAEIDVAAILGVAPFLIGEYMNVMQGRMVAKGQPIASRRKAWGEPITNIMSPTYGTVTRADRQTGKVLITPLFKSTDVLAYVRGTVSEIMPDEGVTIRAHCTQVAGVFGLGGETYGEVLVPATDGAHILTEEQVLALGEELSGRIVVAGATATPGALAALRGTGVRALIAGYLPVEQIQAFAPGLNMGITGKEDVPFTVVLTEGFRQASIAPDVFSVFSHNRGSLVSCDGTTHIRAGVIRPEVLIPSAPVTEEASMHTAPSQVSGVVPGSRVRLLRRPYVGLRGTVLCMNTDRQTLESGIVAHTCTVVLDDGRNVSIPRSNCTPE